MKPDLALHTWNLTRVLRLLAGIVFFVMGIVDGPWLLSAAALVLIYQGVYNAGCSLIPGSSCAIPRATDNKKAS